MQITVITVGKVKEAFYRNNIDSLVRSIQRNHQIELIEVPDEKAPENLSEAMYNQIKDKEGIRILNHIKDDMVVITLEILGKEINSQQLINEMKQLTAGYKTKVCFVIGGSLGLSEAVSRRSDFKLSFSKMTFPHQLMKVVLMEAIDNCGSF